MRVEAKLGSDGIWFARPYLGTDALGRQIRPYRRFPTARDGDEAQQMAEAWAANLTADGRVRSARLVDLLGDYISMKGRNGASPNSIRSYRLFAFNYVAGRLKGRAARDLTVRDLQRFEQSLLAPKDEGGQGLSRNSVIAVHNFLRGAYNWFVSIGVCDENPMLYVSEPSPERIEAAALDEWDFATVDRALDERMSPESETPGACRAATLAFASWITLRTGLRCGEVCAVRRRDVKRRGPFIHVGGTVIAEPGMKPYRRDVTKGKKCRNVGVTADEIEAIDALMALQDRVLGPFGPDCPLVTVDGSYMRPTDVSTSFSELRDELGLPKRLTFHGLRHTHAAWWLMAGGDLKSLSERLGDADEATALRIYAHVLPGRGAEMARVVSAEMGRAGGVPNG